LLESGTQVEIKNVNGNHLVYPIKNLRTPTQVELGTFKLSGGVAGAKILENYFPILIDSGVKVNDQVSMPQGILFIDRNGEKYEPELVNAILNGVEIDTSAQY
jgi:hypothetical protein